MSIRAVFSKYSITPARALNFGPVAFNTPALPRALEVTNIGEVPFSLQLFDPVKGLQVSQSSKYVMLPCDTSCIEHKRVACLCPLLMLELSSPVAS